MFLTLTYLLTCTQVKHTCTVSGDMHPVAYVVPVLALVMARHHTPLFSQTSYQPSSPTPFLSTLLRVLVLRLIASCPPTSSEFTHQMLLNVLL